MSCELDPVINEYIEQLRTTYECEAYYFTLMGTLTLIDICAALNSKDGETAGDKFKEWYETYVSDYHSNENLNFDSQKCWRFRCKMVHQGRPEHDVESTDVRILFCIDNAQIHKCKSDCDGYYYYYLDIKIFMEDVIKGVKEWYQELGEENHVKENIDMMIKKRNQDPGCLVGGRLRFIG